MSYFSPLTVDKTNMAIHAPKAYEIAMCVILGRASMFVHG